MNHVQNLLQSWGEHEKWARETMDRIIEHVDEQCRMTTPISIGEFSSNIKGEMNREVDTSPGALSGE